MEGGVINLTYKQPCTLTFNVVNALIVFRHDLHVQGNVPL